VIRVAFGQSVARLQQGSAAAVSILLKVMMDPATPAPNKVRAANSVLDHAAKASEIEDIEAHVAALEDATQSNYPREHGYCVADSAITPEERQSESDVPLKRGSRLRNTRQVRVPTDNGNKRATVPDC